MIRQVAAIYLFFCLPSDAQTWQQIGVSGAPSGREGHVAVFDSATSQMLVFGGSGTPGGSGSGFKNDLWTFHTGANAWSPAAVAGTPPAARSHSSAVYDSVNSRMTIFGGD